MPTTSDQPTPPQHPDRDLPYPGHESQMAEQPRDEMTEYEGRGLLAGKTALVTGGDSGIGRAVAIAFAKEGADVAIAYLSEHDDAARTRELVEATGARCLLLPGDLADEAHCEQVVPDVVAGLGPIDILVNNAGYQQSQDDVESIGIEQWRHTFAVNVTAPFLLVKAALKDMPDGGCIVNTASITGLRGSGHLIDYSATKGALIALTYSLAQALQPRGIRVNAVAPGPVWTPLIPATMPPEHVASFGTDVPMGRPAHPDEIAPSFVFFAADRLSSYYSGEVLAPLGGQTMPG